MKKAAIWLVFAGFAFTFFHIEVLGVDILMDPVGYLLMFNGANTLRKLEGRKLAAVPAALSLILVSALQMFVVSTLWLAALQVLRIVLEVLLLASLLHGVTAQVFPQGTKSRVLHTIGIVVTTLYALSLPLAFTGISGGAVLGSAALYFVSFALFYAPRLLLLGWLAATAVKIV